MEDKVYVFIKVHDYDFPDVYYLIPFENIEAMKRLPQGGDAPARTTLYLKPDPNPVYINVQESPEEILQQANKGFRGEINE